LECEIRVSNAPLSSTNEKFGSQRSERGPEKVVLKKDGEPTTSGLHWAGLCEEEEVQTIILYELTVASPYMEEESGPTAW